MELNKAIEMVSEACYHYDEELYENCNYSEAFDTVLEELNDSISKDKIENKIKELKEKLENVRNKEDRIRNGVAILVLEYCIDSMNELLNKE